MLKTVKDISITEGQNILIRSSLNAPDNPPSDVRLKQSARTIAYCMERKARVTVVGHKGRDGESLDSISKRLSHFVEHTFVKDIVGETAKNKRDACQPGEVILLDNIRRDPREEENSKEYAQLLLHNADTFVFDAFPAAHREHVTTSQLLTIAPNAAAGIRFSEEIEALQNALHPKHPSLAVIGGAKLATKAVLLQNLITVHDYVAVGGVLANTILSIKGYEVGMSVVEDVSSIEHIGDIVNSDKLILPEHVVVERNSEAVTVPLHEVKKDDAIKDVFLEEIIPKETENVVWNGPLGQSDAGYIQGTAALAKTLSSRKGVIVGGGDTLSCLDDEVLKTFMFVSIGGGAMLHFLTHKTLPPLDILNQR